jgi:starch phosphorylase
MSLQRFLPPELPAGLEDLADLAFDLRWNACTTAADLWQAVDPELWETTRNPVMIIESISHTRLLELADNTDFMQTLRASVQARWSYLEADTWMAQTAKKDALGCVAYFSMEFGLSESLPIYSGGLGMLAGDHLKTASDLGLPLVGVGLLYQQGYFRQSINAAGEQLAFYPFNDPLWLPVIPVRDDSGEWLSIELALPGRTLILRTWQASVGRIRLYLLDSNDPRNDPRDRSITSELYGGGHEQRLQQEMVLGIGGWRLLETLGQHCEVLHLNEGHAAFAVLERARTAMETGRLDFATALRLTRVGNLFTTHTPVPAGFDSFETRLIEQYLGNYAVSLGLELKELLALGRSDPGDKEATFNMALLALRGSGAVNGVSRLHGEVSRRLFASLFPRLPLAEVPVGHVTNGVHVPTWESREADEIWSQACGESRWRGDLVSLETDFRALPDTVLWSLRSSARQRLVDWVRQRHSRQIAVRGMSENGIAEQADILDPDTLTLGFARRFAAYKRPNLLLSDPDRLERLLCDPTRPVQLVIAGKAHPQDNDGQWLVRAWNDFLRRPAVRLHAVFIEDYDIDVATHLVQGVDLWINTPRRPWEASGTSGMKVLVNGGLNLSELDGWWVEAYQPDVGWALGDGAEHGSDPAWDRQEAEALYALLEQEVIPAYYERDAEGLPQKWLSYMRESMARLTGQFSTNRMVREYTESYYLPAAAAYRERCSANFKRVHEIEHWLEHLQRHWSGVRIATVSRNSDGEQLRVDAQVYIDDLEPDSIRVELYADPQASESRPERIPLQRGETLTATHGGYHYYLEFHAGRPAADYTVRVVPTHPLLRWPLENSLVCWEN